MTDEVKELSTPTSLPDLPHPFETAIWCLVTENFRITLHGIAQQEEEMTKYLEQTVEGDPDTLRSLVAAHRGFYEELTCADGTD
jgi:hypothetical protein